MLELLAKRVMEALDARLEHGVRTDSRDIILASVVDSLGLASMPLFGQTLYGQTSSQPEEILEDENIIARVLQAVAQKTPPVTLERRIFERIKTLPSRPAIARVVHFGSKVLIAHALGNAPDGFVWQAWAILGHNPEAVPLEAFVAGASVLQLPEHTRLVGLSQETRGVEHLASNAWLALGKI